MQTNSARRIDNLIWAEIPDKDTNPKLYKLVSDFMIHGPHSTRSSCLENSLPNANICEKKFPKDFREETTFQDDSYPLYKRPNNGRFVSKPSPTNRGGIEKMDNRWVVPYCPKLLLKYQSHINVEVCSSIKAVKYIMKYPLKGFDVSQLNIIQVDPNNPTNNVYDEIAYYSSKNIFFI